MRFADARFAASIMISCSMMLAFTGSECVWMMKTSVPRTDSSKRQWISPFENRRMLYDNVSLVLSLAPVVLIWPTVITAPMAIFVAIRYWKAPLSIVTRTRVRFVLAIVFALCQIAAWGFIAYALTLMRPTDGPQ